jgi:hypothetical protein
MTSAKPTRTRNFLLFNRTADRLMLETYNLRTAFAAWRTAHRLVTSSSLLKAADRALQSDVMIRLIRILDFHRTAASFWYLDRCDSRKVGEGADIPKLRGLAKRLARVRHKVFVHIDRKMGFDPQKVYKDANLKGAETRWAIILLGEVLNRLYTEQHGKPYQPWISTTLDELSQDFEDGVASR